MEEYVSPPHPSQVTWQQCHEESQEQFPIIKKKLIDQVQAFQVFHRPNLILNDHSNLCLMSLKALY